MFDFDIVLSTGETYLVSIRPFLEQCLDHLVNLYEMVVFTAAE